MTAKTRLIYAYSALVLAYAIGVLLLPPVQGTLQKYHITLVHLRLLSTTILVLYAAIWFAAFYGFYKIYHYAYMIRKNKDGSAVGKIAIGIGILAFWLPVSAIYNTYMQYLAQKHPSLSEAIAVSQNYLSLLLPLLGFIYISIGSRRLSELTKQRPSLRGINLLSLLVITLGTIYVYLVANTHNRLNDTYHMPIMLVMLTLVIPYIFMWFLGFMSFYEIYMYKNKVAGIIYRKSWSHLMFGLGWLIIVTISLQYLTTVSLRLNKLSLNKILLIVYILLILMATGYILIALGVRNLKKIEEV